jgi:predicted dehydrogenase
MEDGITATVTFSGYSPVGYEAIYIGTEGAVKVIDGKKIAIRNGATWDEVPEVDDGRHMIRQLVAFSKLIRGEDSEMPDGEYGRAIIRAIEEIYLKGL